MKPGDGNSGQYSDFKYENRNKDATFKVAYHVRISKLKNNFAKS